MMGKVQETFENDQNSQARFRAVAQSSNDAIILANSDGEILFWNTAAQILFGYNESEILGKALTRLIPERYKAAHTQGLAKAAQTGETHLVGQTVELAAVRKDGMEFPIELTLSTWREENKPFFSGIIRDISARKKTEAALRKSERRYRDMFNYAVEGMYQSSPNGQFLGVNPALARLLGYESPDVLRRAITDIARELYVEAERRSDFCHLLETNQVISNFESQVFRKDGRPIWISESARLVLGQGKSPTCYEGFVIDITSRKESEELQVKKAQLEVQNSYLQEEVNEVGAFGSLVGQSPALCNVLRQIDLVAPTEATVLILGESGTGKELVAREIHARSLRKHHPLIRVNCASIPRELYESEFFGHVKGAFTGAVKDRIGRFETANGGTLFLDEVGEIPLELQSKFLRVLQEQQYERVGDDLTRHVNVRIIAATNRNLKEEVLQKRFRQDLYYRLNVFPIEMVPLRQRLEDIPLLAHHFLSLGSHKLHCSKPSLTKNHMKQFQRYSWPGNVRELQNIIERALIKKSFGDLHWELDDSQKLPPPSTRKEIAENFIFEQVLTEEAIQTLVKKNTLAALNQARWRIYGSHGAAKRLGVKPTTLLARIKKMNLKEQYQFPD